MVVMGLDFGEKRIGLAVSDAGGRLARPLRVVERRSLAEDVHRIAELVKESGARRVVVGLPLSLDGSRGPAARRAERFAKLLARELGVEVVMQDERLTTSEAERALLADNRSRAQRREVRDAVAAALILQSYLDTHPEPRQ